MLESPGRDILETVVHMVCEFSDDDQVDNLTLIFALGQLSTIARSLEVGLAPLIAGVASSQ